MLRDDHREKSLAQRIDLALKDAELVLAAIRIVRHEHDEAALRQPRAEGLVIAVAAGVGVLGDDIVWNTFQPVLAYDHWPALAGLEIFGHEQVSPRENFGQNVEHDFVAGPLGTVSELARTRVDWRGGRVKSP